MKTTTITFLAFVALVFNWFFFWLYWPPSEVQWICWGMFHAALVGVLTSSFLTSWKRDMSAILYAPSAIIAGLMVIVTAAMSMGFIAWNPASPMIPLTAYAILFAAAIGFHISWSSISKGIQNSEDRDKAGLMFIRQCVLAVEYIIQTEPDLDRKKELEAVSDALRSAQVSSIPEVKPLEKQIENDVNELQRAVSAKEPTAEIQSRLLDAINQRNRIILANR